MYKSQSKIVSKFVKKNCLIQDNVYGHHREKNKREESKQLEDENRQWA